MATIYSAPTLRPAFPPNSEKAGEKTVWAFDLQTAINKARPGDEVVLLPGRYTTCAVIRVSGEADAPITLRPAIAGSVVLDGLRAPTDFTLGGIDPLDADFAMLRFFRADHWIIEGMQFVNCWPSCIYMRSARHVTVQDCTAEGGRFFTYLRQSPSDPTHHITIQSCRWVQDPSFDMWRGALTWDDIKGTTEVNATYLNGAFLGGFDVAGRLVVRDCDIRHAFNAIRLDMREKHVDDRPVSLRNRDVAIFDNRFSFIRDNAIEPEKGAQNWRIFNNRFYCAHASFSQDQVRSRDMFYFVNTILNDHRPGLIAPDGKSLQSAQGGKIHKWFKPEDPDKNGKIKEPAPRRGFWSILNAVQTRTSYAKTAWTRHWHDAFTVLGLYPTMHPQSVNDPRHPLQAITWDGVTIDGFVTDDIGFPRDYDRPHGHVLGTQVARAFHAPVFANGPMPNVSACLGGWDGLLIPTEEVTKMRTAALKLDTFDGVIELPADMPLGTSLDVADLGLAHWRDPWPDGPPGQNLA